MTHCNTVLPIILRTSYGTHLLDHLAAYGTGLTAGEVAIVALLQVDAHFDWLTAVEVMDLPEFDHCTNAYHNWFQEILNSIL